MTYFVSSGIKTLTQVNQLHFYILSDLILLLVVLTAFVLSQISAAVPLQIACSPVSFLHLNFCHVFSPMPLEMNVWYLSLVYVDNTVLRLQIFS